MLKLNPYLGIDGGKCAEALEFYKDAFSGEVTSKMTYGDSGQTTDPTMKDRIMHSEFRAKDVYFMACDQPAHQPVQRGNQISLAIALDDTGVQDQIFRKLSSGGTVTMPLADQFWGARFGMVLDKYGIHWMLNCEKRK